jgi:hypothetical protein
MSTSHRGRLGVALALGLLVFACVLYAHGSGLALGLAYLSPAVFVFALLCLGHYPGERLLLARTRPRCPKRSVPAARMPRRVLAQMPRGGGLLASALAGRAPPPSLSHSKFSTA